MFMHWLYVLLAVHKLPRLTSQKFVVRKGWISDVRVWERIFYYNIITLKLHHEDPQVMF